MKNSVLKILRHNTSALANNESVVVIGNFDGVHNGHKRMMEKAVKLATAENLASVVMTFRPYPFTFFSHPGSATKNLSKLSDQYRAISPLGVNYLYAHPFTENTASLSPEAFVEQVLSFTLNAKHVIVGEDFRFGKNRVGAIDTLEMLGAEFGFKVHQQVEVKCDAGERFSSSRTRLALADGDVSLAHTLLGHFWEVRVFLRENDYCDLTADLSAYAPLKDGGYFVKLTFVHSVSKSEMCSIIPVIVQGQKLWIKPFESLPDIPEGMASIAFIEPLHDLSAPKSCAHNGQHS